MDGKKKVIFGLFMLCLLISLASAIDTYSQNSEFNIVHPVRINGGIPNAATNCNISIYYSNGNPLISIDEMTRLSSSNFNYTINSSQSAIKGLYDYDITCISGELNKTTSYKYLINLGGIEPSQQRTDTLSRTIWIFFGLALLFFITFLFTKYFPVKASLFLLMLWFIIMGVNTAFISLQDEVINSNIENFFSFFLTLSYYLNYGIFFGVAVIWVTTFFVNIFTFKESKKQRRFNP
jgi:hypothetical protein